MDFQQDLCFLILQVIASRPDFKDIRFETARMEYEVDHGRVDIAILKSGGQPFLVIETKRKNGAIQHDIDPLSPRVIAQALGYAVQCGSPYFATANPDYLAIFRVPQPGRRFRLERYRVFISAIPSLSREFATQFLEAVVDYHLAKTEKDRARVATGIDWTFIIRLRSFVDWLTRRAEPAITNRLRDDTKLKKRIKAFQQEKGIRLDASQVSREMAYILMNKIVFHKVLERKYNRLTPLSVDDTTNVNQLLRRLNSAFIDVMIETRDFEAIFSAGLYDDISLSDERYDLLDIVDGIQGFIEDMETYQLEQLEADVIGHVYEALIPDEERHVLGQFYTPPAVADFITRWAIQSSDDVVLDPAAGSGTFLVKAYQRLKALRMESGLKEPATRLNREILSRLFALDINPFPIHLTAMNLAMRDVRHPVTELNTLERDFFQVSPRTPAFVPYTIQTASGKQRRREITVPMVDVVVANPPYTRWLEIPEETRNAINIRLEKALKEYGLVARVRGGVETAIYQHFVFYSHTFLKKGGKLGMIISNSWLQTDVGIRFANFLLDRFKIHAVIDLGPRLFPIPLVATCIILLEKCDDEKEREETQSVFAFIEKDVTVDELSDLLGHPKTYKDRLTVEVRSQKDLPRDRKWIEVLFDFPGVDSKLREKTISVRDSFEVTRGNIQYCADKKRGLGANDFFYLDREEVRQRGLSDFVRPCIAGARDVPNFSFGPQDWRSLRKKRKKAFLFSCREPRERLPGRVKSYIEWGETQCRTRGGSICAEAQACSERNNDPENYAGWYDVGDVRKTDLFSFRYAQYRHCFTSMDEQVAIDDDFIAFKSKGRMKKMEKQAILGFLNSSLGQVYIEIQGRTTGGGMCAMEAKHAEQLRMPNLQKLPKHQVKNLADLQAALEKRSREIGGAHGHKAESDLAAEYSKVDEMSGKIVGLTREEVERIQRLCKALRDRRIQRAKQPSPEVLRGTDRPFQGRPPKKRRRRPSGPMARRLEEFSE